MAKLTLSTISSRYGSIDALNANFDAVEAALENTLSLDGTAPNGMEVDLDMNSHKVINLSDPTNNGDAVSRGWLLEQEGNAVASADAAAASASAAENSAVAAAAAAASVNPTLYAQKSANLSDLTSAATARTNLGLVINTNVQAYDAATVKTNVAQTFTSLQTFTGTSSNADVKTSNILEVATVSATAATGTINYDVTTQSVLYYTTNASGNFTVNFRGSSGTTLNTIMATGESLSATFLVTNGATAYYNSAVQVDGSSVTPKWQGGTAPTSGNASSIDSYTYVIIKTGSAAFTVLASVTKFA
jgi:hypothetical protein